MGKMRVIQTLDTIHEKCKNSTNRLWNAWTTETQRRCVNGCRSVGAQAGSWKDRGAGLYKGNGRDRVAGMVVCERPPRNTVLVYFIECQSAACAAWCRSVLEISLTDILSFEMLIYSLVYTVECNFL